MSTYLIAEAAVLAVCRASSGGTLFTATNSSRDNWEIIDNASSPYGLVVEMGGETIEGDNLDGRGTQGTIQERHLITVTVSIKVGTQAQGIETIASLLKATVETLKNYIRTKDRLGVYAPVSRAWPSKTSPVLERVPRGTGNVNPTHFMQTITLTVYCESDSPANEGGY